MQAFVLTVLTDLVFVSSSVFVSACTRIETEFGNVYFFFSDLLRKSDAELSIEE
jgi:hypothetical protein